MEIDFEKLARLLEQANNFSKEEEKIQMKKTQYAFLKILSSESINDIENISDQDIDNVIDNIVSLCEEDDGTNKRYKKSFLNEILNSTIESTNRIL